MWCYSAGEINPFLSEGSACWCTSPIVFFAKQINLSVLLENEWSWSPWRNDLSMCCVSMSMSTLWVKCETSLPKLRKIKAQSVQHLHLESWFTSRGLVWDWHMLSVRVPTVQTCYYCDLILFLKRLAHSARRCKPQELTCLLDENCWAFSLV